MSTMVTYTTDELTPNSFKNVKDLSHVKVALLVGCNTTKADNNIPAKWLIWVQNIQWDLILIFMLMKLKILSSIFLTITQTKAILHIMPLILLLKNVFN